MEFMAFNHALVGEGVADPLRQEDGGPGLVPVPVGVGPGQAVVFGVAAAKLQRFVVVVFMPGVSVDDLRAVDGGLLNRGAALAEGMGLDVILGAELRFPENDNDYLVYGIDEQWLRSNPYVCCMSAQEFFDKFHDQVLIIHAHPFRKGSAPVQETQR